MYAAALDAQIGRLTYGDGKRVYGHRRLTKRRKKVTTELLRAKFSTAPAPQDSAAPDVAEAVLRTTAKRRMRFDFVRIAGALVGLGAIAALAASPMWMPLDPFLSAAAAGAVASAGGLSVAVALGML